MPSYAHTTCRPSRLTTLKINSGDGRGSAASATIENKLKPYYTRAGVDHIVLTVNNDSTFTMKFAKGSLSGTLAQGEPGFIQFKFKAMKKINLGTINGAVSKVGNQISVTFDISKRMTLASQDVQNRFRKLNLSLLQTKGVGNSTVFNSFFRSAAKSRKDVIIQ